MYKSLSTCENVWVCKLVLCQCPSILFFSKGFQLWKKCCQPWSGRPWIIMFCWILHLQQWFVLVFIYGCLMVVWILLLWLSISWMTPKCPCILLWPIWGEWDSFRNSPWLYNYKFCWKNLVCYTKFVKNEGTNLSIMAIILHSIIMSP